MNTKLLFFSLGISMTFTMKAYEVPTTVQKKNILLEEFTGIHCGYCPQGHVIANTLLTAQPTCTYVIAIHAGNFAKPSSDEPDFRTEEGQVYNDELGANQAGYPCGTVNRHIFDGSSVITSRAAWIKNAKTIFQEDAPVNLWMKSEFNGGNRELKVKVEGYYTDNIDLPSLLLNVAWTQSDIQGPQSGGSVGDEYMHKHMLRGTLTPVWGGYYKSTEKRRIFHSKIYLYSTRSYKKSRSKSGKYRTHSLYMHW